MIHTHEKGQGQRSLGSKVLKWKQTDGQTDRGDCITSLLINQSINQYLFTEA